MSLVFLAELVPAVVIGTACGPLIDRRDRGSVLAALTALQAVVLMPLLALEVLLNAQAGCHLACAAIARARLPRPRRPFAHDGRNRTGGESYH